MKLKCYICPSKNKINNIVGLNISKEDIIDFSEEDCVFYNQPANYHHWTLTSAWNFYKKILENEHIELTDVKEVIIDMFGVPEKTFIPTIGRYRVTEYLLGQVNEGGPEILYNLNKTNRFAGYKHSDDFHDLLCMVCALIENFENKDGESLLLMADSMSVALVPVLAQYFSKILLVDLRHGAKIPDIDPKSFDRCIAVQVNDEIHSRYTQCNIDLINEIYKK